MIIKYHYYAGGDTGFSGMGAKENDLAAEL